MSGEIGWLIEHLHDPRYGRESWYAGKDGFVIDSLQAVRFARKEDAEREIDRFPITLAKSLRATNHAWISSVPMRIHHLGFVLTPGSRQIALERHRQIAVEGYDYKHDDEHGVEELAAAAVAYAIDAIGRSAETRTTRGLEISVDYFAMFWPWKREEFNPTENDRERQLVKAGALIAAAIDALCRSTNQQKPSGEP